MSSFVQNKNVPHLSLPHIKPYRNHGENMGKNARKIYLNEIHLPTHLVGMGVILFLILDISLNVLFGINLKVAD